MRTKPSRFTRLSVGWNADPNVPQPNTHVLGENVVLTFFSNETMDDMDRCQPDGKITFQNCSQYRFTNVNDEGWYMGQCRFSSIAPEWGEFYEVHGDFLDQVIDEPWKLVSTSNLQRKNFLFYFKDNTFECVASGFLKEF